jgi:hypothetical protein
MRYAPDVPFSDKGVGAGAHRSSGVKDLHRFAGTNGNKAVV